MPLPPPPGHDALLAEFERLLAAKPALAANVMATAPLLSETRPTVVTVATGEFTGRGVSHERDRAMLAFHVRVDGKATVTTTDDATITRNDPCTAHHEAVSSRYTAWGGAEARDGNLWQHEHALKRAHGLGHLATPWAVTVAMDPAAVAMVADADDGEWLHDGGGVLADAMRLAATARLVRHIGKAMGPDRAGLFADMMRGRPCLGLFDAAAAIRVMDTPNPAWVRQAVAATPFLRRLYDTTTTLWRCALPHVEALASGRPPLDVVEAMMADRTQVSPAVAGLRPSALRSISAAAVYPDEALGTVARLVDAFLAARPAHRRLAPDEVHAVEDAVTRVGYLADDASGAWIGALMDGSGRVRRLPGSVHDALASLPADLGTIMDLLREAHRGTRAAAAAATGIAFPPGRRNAGLARVDAEWHARVNDRLDLVAAARDAIAARRRGQAAARPFPTTHDRPVRIGDVVATPLLHAGDYLREGREMGHCIGSMHGSARMGHMFAFSVADAAWPADAEPTERRLVPATDPGTRSTAAFDVLHDGRARLRQHLGRGNRPAPAAHAAAVAALDADIRDTGRGRHVLASRREAPDGRSDDVSDLLPDERRALLDALFGAVSTFLPPSEAAMGPEAWWAARGRALSGLA